MRAEYKLKGLSTLKSKTIINFLMQLLWKPKYYVTKLTSSPVQFLGNTVQSMIFASTDLLILVLVLICWHMHRC